MIDISTEFKELLKDGNCKKDFAIYVGYLEGETRKPYSPVWYDVITASYLISESVKFDERLCSESTIKFGLCEGTSLEFEYFDKPNIKGRTVQVKMVIYDHDAESLDIDMGYFTVDTVSRQASTGIYKVTAYNKLKSKYLDEKANNQIVEVAADNVDDNKTSVNSILAALLDDYAIKEKNDAIPYLWIDNYDVMIFNNLNGNYATVDLHGSSEGSSAELGISFDVEISNNAFVIQGIKEFCEYTEKAIDSFKDFIIDNLINGQDYWDNLIKNFVFTRIFKIAVRETATTGNTVNCIYIPKKYITSSTLTYGNVTYHVRPLDTLYRIVRPTGLDRGHEQQHSLWIRIFTSAYLEDTNPSASQPIVATWEFEEKDNFLNVVPNFYLNYISSDNIGEMEVVKSDLPDVTLRELQSAIFETQCQFGKLDRESDLFSGVELNQSRLYPQETLYPANNLYPYGGVLSSTRSMYSKLWADEDNVQKWKYLIITYQDTNGDEKTLQRTVNNDGTQNYNCSSNWLFKNLQWTAEQIGAYADAMVAKMQPITWFPFEMWCAGLPYLETGDEIEIPIGETTYVSYVLQRTLKGIQNLQDTYINGELDIF